MQRSKHTVFRVGDKVKLRKDMISGRKYGSMYFIDSRKKFFEQNKGQAVIKRFENPCLVLIKKGEKSCHFDITMLEHVKPDKIIIYQKDDFTVIANNVATGEQAEARCNPLDTFDFNTGAKLAFNRLMGVESEGDKPEPKYYSGKIVCIKDAYGYFTVGKVYIVKDGLIYEGKKTRTDKHFISIDHINNIMTSQFAALIE